MKRPSRTLTRASFKERPELDRLFLTMELRGFSGALKSNDGGLAIGDGLRHLVKVTSSDKTLVTYRRIAILLGGVELFLLQACVCCHSLFCVIPSQFEHAQIQSMETGEG